MKQVPKLEDFLKVCECELCGCVFGIDGKYAKCCPACRLDFNVRRQMQWRARVNPTVQAGVGSGGGQFGHNNHQYTVGKGSEAREVFRGYTSSTYRTIARRLWGDRCVVCGSDAVRDVHHLDKNPYNNSASNIIPLCRDCHVKMHGSKWHGSTVAEVVENKDRLLSQAVKDRLQHIKELENEEGDVDEAVLNYEGALYIVKNGIPEMRMHGRTNAKQHVLVTALRNCNCVCANCGHVPTTDRLVTVWSGDGRKKVEDPNVSMLCRGCYNAIVSARLNPADYIQHVELPK